MLLYHLVIGTICFCHFLNLNSDRAMFAYPQAQLNPKTSLFHSLIVAAIAVFEQLLPTLSALMLERVPLIICILDG